MSNLHQELTLALTPPPTALSDSTHPQEANLPVIIAMEPVVQPVASRSRISTVLRFPLAVLISLGTSSILYSLAANVTGPELAAVSRNLTESWQIGAMIAWKVFELGVAWYAGYDCEYINQLIRGCCIISLITGFLQTTTWATSRC